MILVLLVMFYFFVGAGVCLLVCVNPNKPGLLGGANRFVFQTIPRKFSQLVSRFFGERVLNILGSLKHYLMETNHPIVQIFYLLIAVGGFICYEIFGIFKHMPNPQVGDPSVIVANALAIICFWVYYKACAVGPGEITVKNVAENVRANSEYYDELLYKTNNKCTTCLLLKPARSKHCSICRMCVARYDHHCIWIRQCVGEKNYKYFLSFLFFHAIWCLFLSYIGFLSLQEYLLRVRFWNMTFNINNQVVKASPLVAVQFLLMSETIFLFLNVICAIMGSTLLIFVTYHFYLVSRGQTTNERVKRNDQISYIQKESKAAQRFQESMGKGEDTVKFKGATLTRDQLEDYRLGCAKRLAVLKKGYPNNGFVANLIEIFKK